MSKTYPPLVEPLPLDAIQAAPYERQWLVPGVGVQGQGRLANARVLLIGCGGLGSPIALYLAGAGVGSIGLVDDDVVSQSNLHRQIIHTLASIGTPKTTSAKRAIIARNAAIQVQEHPLRLDESNAPSLFAGYDLIIDGSDNLATRYLVNDTAAALGKPVVYGSVIKAEGQVSVFWAGQGPTYRDLMPGEPDQALIPRAAEVGVLGPVCAQVGAYMAMEAIKLICGIGQPLIGRLLLINALAADVMSITIPVTPTGSLPPNSEERTVATADAQDQSIPQISPADLAKRLSEPNPPLVLDVRGDDEREICVIDGSTCIPLPELMERLDELGKDAEIITQCKGGVRSMQAAQILVENGFTNVTNLEGGILAWADQVDPEMETY